MSLQTLMENHLGTGWGVFYVEPTIVALCIEMYSKALASNLDGTFRATDFGHNSKKLIVEYQNRLPLFARIAADAEMMDLIAEYQKTMDVKYGEMYVKAPKSEQAQLIALIHELREELCGRTGLR